MLSFFLTIGYSASYQNTLIRRVSFEKRMRIRSRRGHGYRTTALIHTVPEVQTLISRRSSKLESKSGHQSDHVIEAGFQTGGDALSSPYSKCGNQANLMLIQPDGELFSQGDLISADDGLVCWVNTMVIKDHPSVLCTNGRHYAFRSLTLIIYGVAGA